MIKGYTKGPWRIGRLHGDEIEVFAPIKREVVAIIPVGNGANDRDWADASLVAAAPLMYETLRKIAELKEPDLVKYCQKVDSIVIDALAEIES